MAEQRLISKLWTEQPELHPYQIVNNGVLVKTRVSRCEVCAMRSLDAIPKTTPGTSAVGRLGEREVRGFHSLFVNNSR